MSKISLGRGISFPIRLIKLDSDEDKSQKKNSIITSSKNGEEIDLKGQLSENTNLKISSTENGEEVASENDLSLIKRSTIALSEYENEIRESIIIILGTRKGERIMRPDFGCSMYDYVFAHINVSTIELMKSSIETSLSIYEPRIEVLDIAIDIDGKNQDTLIINIDYKIIATGIKLNLIYSFSKEGL